MAPLGRLILLALSAAVFSSPAFSQPFADTYEYDALGRMTKVQNGNGSKSAYIYDPAGSRTTVSVQRQLDTGADKEAWEAETLPHTTGFAQYAGWAANPSYPTGALTYGPYTNSLHTGSHTAVWRMMIDNNTNPGADQVVTLDVYDSETDQVLASRTLTPSSFAASKAYEIFELPFTTDASREGHHLEFRSLYLGKSYVNVDKVARY